MQNREVAHEIETVARNSPPNTEVGVDQAPPRHSELSPFRPIALHDPLDAHETSGTKDDSNPEMDVGFDQSLPSNVE
jgi:hypothetical protein